MEKHSILIVDDDTLILGTLKKRFNNWDTDVYAASSPEEAQKILEERTPELLLLDLMLNKDDGSSEILSYIKSQARLSAMVILVLTNLDKPELKETLLAQGVTEYIVKGSMPIDDLYNKVMGYLEPAGKGVGDRV